MTRVGDVVALVLVAPLLLAAALVFHHRNVTLTHRSIR